MTPLRHRHLLFHTLVLGFCGAMLLSHPVSAAATKTTDFVVGKTGTPHATFGGVFRGGSSVAVGNVTGDSAEEIIVGAGLGGGPQIEIYDQAGHRLKSFFAFRQAMREGLSVAAADLDGDGTDEIIIGPRGNYVPEVQIYRGDGTRVGSFLAFDELYNGGIDVGAMASRNGQPGMIFVTRVGGDREVKAFDRRGVIQFSGWYPQGQQGNGLSVAGMWSDTFHQPVLVSVAGRGEKPLVLVHGIWSGTLLASWLAYDARVTTGLDVAATNDRIVIVPGRRGGPDVRVFNARGRLQYSYNAYDSSFHGGLEVALTSDGTPVVVPQGKPERSEYGKKILVDLSDQTLTLVENGQVISVRRVSTGKWSTPTPVGTYRTRNKIGVAYSKTYNLFMEYWMAFTPDGSYGLHALPFWKLASGGKLYEGAAHIGTPVSHGCIRQNLSEAKSLFEWAPIGTTVVVQQ